MGNEASLPMEMATNFDAEEIKRLGKRFKKLDLDNSGSLSVDEFMSLPELQQVIYLIRIPSDNIQSNSFVQLIQLIYHFVLLLLESAGAKGHRHIR